MPRSFLKLFILIVTLYSNMFAITQKDNTNFQNEINTIKIELEKIKVIQQYSNKDDKLNKIENSIKVLEDKLTKSMEKDLSVQDKRISDLNLYIAIYGVIITVLLLIASWGSYKFSLNETHLIIKKWLDEKADKEFQPKVDDYLEQLQNKGNSLLEEIKLEASKQHQEHKDKNNKIIKEFESKTSQMIIEEKDRINKEFLLQEKGKAEVDSDVEKLGNDETKYKYNNWYSKFLQKYLLNEFDKALEYINKALIIAENDKEKLKALLAKGLIFGAVGNTDEALKEYNKIIDEFGQNKNEEVLEFVGNALINKAITLGSLGKIEEEIKEYDKIVDKFWQSENETLLEFAGNALGSKGVRLGIMGQNDEEIIVYNKVIERFSHSTNEKLLVIFAKALVNKGVRLGQIEGKREEALVEYNRVITRFSESKNEKLLEQVAKALANKGFVLGFLSKYQESISEYDKVIKKFSESKNEKILEQVAYSLANKGLRLADLGKIEESISEYDKVIKKFSKSKNENITKIYESVLLNKIEILLISNQNIEDDLKIAQKSFNNNQNNMIKYKMLEILYNAQLTNQDTQIEEWKEQYKNIDLGSWRFDELDEWNDTMSDIEVKERIKRYIDIFKTKIKK